MNSEDVLEWANDEEGNGEPETPHETIEKVLKHRRGRKGAVGHPTTSYNVEDKKDPNQSFDEQTEGKGEKQYLIKVRF